MNSNIRARRCAALAFLAATLLAPAARAGLSGQPRVPAAVAAKIRAAAGDILGTGDLGEARPNIYLAVEANATADLTDLLAGVVRDDTTYNGLVDTFEQAARSKSGEAGRFVTYNLARLHLLRARVADRRAALAQAQAGADRLARTSPRDPAALELIGDIYAEQGRLEPAIAAYRRLATSGAPGAPAYAQLKMALLYHRLGRLTEAEAAYSQGIRRDAASDKARRETLHRLYQGLAALHLERNNLASAADALTRSARVMQDRDAPYRLRLDVAQRLLQSGRAAEALAYTEAALRFTPDDEAARALRDQARARLRTP